MDIKDVCLIAILDSSLSALYLYNQDKTDLSALTAFLREENNLLNSLTVFNERTLFINRMNDITVVLLSNRDSNEIFVSQAFGELINSLNKTIKNWCVDRVFEKYDQIMLIVYEFVYKGIIMTDQSEELNTRIMKRTFESVNATKVNKGLASFLNRATKSFRK